MNTVEKIELTGEIATPPTKGRSPQGKPCVVVEIATGRGEWITLAAFSREAMFHLSRVTVGEVVDIVGRPSKLAL
jgi:hypothetical protein